MLLFVDIQQKIFQQKIFQKRYCGESLFLHEDKLDRLPVDAGDLKSGLSVRATCLHSRIVLHESIIAVERHRFDKRLARLDGSVALLGDAQVRSTYADNYAPVFPLSFHHYGLGFDFGCQGGGGLVTAITDIGGDARHLVPHHVGGVVCLKDGVRLLLRIFSAFLAARFDEHKVLVGSPLW